MYDRIFILMTAHFTDFVIFEVLLKGDQLLVHLGDSCINDIEWV